MKRTLIISSSPSRDGNSCRMAAAALAGCESGGNLAELVYVDDYIEHFLRDCRQCWGDDHQCQLDDRFRELFLEKYLPADGVIFATPLYWYGMSGQLCCCASQLVILASPVGNSLRFFSDFALPRRGDRG